MGGRRQCYSCFSLYLPHSACRGDRTVVQGLVGRRSSFSQEEKTQQPFGGIIVHAGGGDSVIRKEKLVGLLSSEQTFSPLSSTIIPLSSVVVILDDDHASSTYGRPSVPTVEHSRSKLLSHFTNVSSTPEWIVHKRMHFYYYPLFQCDQKGLLTNGRWEEQVRATKKLLIIVNQHRGSTEGRGNLNPFDLIALEQVSTTHSCLHNPFWIGRKGCYFRS